jgi:hypothetical protein
MALGMPAAAKLLAMPRPMTPEPMTRTSACFIVDLFRIDKVSAGERGRKQGESA